MKIYHGTNELHLRSILREGLRPRGSKKGNWKDYPSRYDMVYLSTAYAPYFSLMGMDKPIVFEVETDKLYEELLHPDEDFIAQTVATAKGVSIKSVHEHVRRNIEKYQGTWRMSIDNMGTCCYQGRIPLYAITRYVTWDISSQSHVSIMAGDPTITPMNYQFCGDKYRNLIAWLFGDEKELQPMMCLHDAPLAMGDRYVNHLKEVSANRKSIEVVTL